MATLGTVSVISYFSMGGTKAKEKGPALNATSKDEEKFIKYAETLLKSSVETKADVGRSSDFLKNAEAEGNKAKH